MIKGEFRNKETVIYTLPEFWVTYLLYGDTSVLEDGEAEVIDKFLEEEGLSDPVGVSDESFFAPFHDAPNYVLPCTCLEYTFWEGER